MRKLNRFRIVAIALVALAVLAWARPPLQARVAPPMAGAAPQAEAPPEKIYVETPVTIEAARTWTKLRRKIDMPFATETPLEDVLKYLRDQTADEKEKDHGLQFYVDPVGLAGAEKQMNSAVIINLEGVPLTTTLPLLLKQLGLIYRVQEDGLVIITSEDGDDLRDPMILALDQLAALRREVAELQKRIVMGGGIRRSAAQR